MSTWGFVGYTYKGKVRGMPSRGDSGVMWLGTEVLKAYLKYTQDEIGDFLLHRLRLSDHGFMAQAVFSLDWGGSQSIDVIDAGDFYKDAISCEYAYIFDFDSKRKRLMIFTGFGRKPTKGYEDWYANISDYRGDVSNRMYMNRKCVIAGNGKFELLQARMRVQCDRPESYSQPSRRAFEEFIKAYRCKRIDLPKYAASEHEEVCALAAARLSIGG